MESLFPILRQKGNYSGIFFIATGSHKCEQSD